jgi:hypothetical protein
MVYRCEEHLTTQYVNADARDTVWPCCDQARLVGVADEGQFCAALKATIADA